MNPSRIEVRPAKRGQFIWHIVASNGRITANGETFPSRGNALRACKAVVRNVAGTLGLRVSFKTLRQAEITIVYPIKAP